MNNGMLLGFRDEMTKSATSVEDGAKGLGIGALLGLIVSTVGVEALEKLVTRNKDIAIATGAIMGAASMAGAGFLLGGKSDSVTNVTPPPGGVFHGPPMPSSRHI